jgi:hypothetical protein
MSTSLEISWKGRKVRVPAVEVAGKTVIVTGRLLRIAKVYEEDYVDGDTSVSPEEVLVKLRAIGSGADILTFAQKVGNEEPAYPYHHEWDNAAALSTQDYDQWWKSLSEATRRNVRLAAKRGVTVREVNFNDEFVVGIKSIYDETPVRQGRHFWHYGKDAATVRSENETFRNQSVFLGAYHGEHLIGFMKFVYVGPQALIMQILATEADRDKKAMNAMIAKAVEVCQRDGKTHLQYCKYTYGNKKDDSVAEFKRRNGFSEARFPQYFIPLTLRGQIALALGLHRGLLGILPTGVIQMLLAMRARALRSIGSSRSGNKSEHTQASA